MDTPFQQGYNAMMEQSPNDCQYEKNTVQYNQWQHGYRVAVIEMLNSF